MARIALEIEDNGNRLLLRAMLQAAGHVIVEQEPEICFADSVKRACELAAHCRTVLLTPASAVADAVRAMEQGVYSYILIPLQPGEAQIMAQRALERGGEPQKPVYDLRTLGEVEREHVLGMLRACKGNQAEAARLLGIGRNTLWRKLRSYGLEET